MATILKYNNKIYKHNNKPIKINWNSGDGLQFDGTNDFVNCGNILNFNRTDAFSFCFICSPLDVDGTILSKLQSNGSGTGYYIFFSVANNIRLTLRTGDTQLTTKVWNYILSLGSLYHVVFTTSNGTSSGMKCYINGVELLNHISESNNATTITNTENFKIATLGNPAVGPLTNVSYYRGGIYDLKIFNKELTALEVRYLYHTQNQLIPLSAMSSLQADWRFNQRSGNTLKDYSPNGYNGTLTNFDNTSLGVNNAWVYNNNQPVTQY